MPIGFAGLSQSSYSVNLLSSPPPYPKKFTRNFAQFPSSAGWLETSPNHLCLLVIVALTGSQLRNKQTLYGGTSPAILISASIPHQCFNVPSSLLCYSLQSHFLQHLANQVEDYHNSW
ncbi:unnamed protein product [Natator depressus]